jgi:hypothetical protein
MTINDHFELVTKNIQANEETLEMMKRLFFAGGAAVMLEMKQAIRTHDESIVQKIFGGMDTELKAFAIEIAMKAVLGECPPPMEPYRA